MAPGNARAMVGNAAPAANANNTSPPPSGAPLAATATAQVTNKPTITLERLDLMDVKAKGTPTGGIFDKPTVQKVIGTTDATIDFDSGSSPNSNPSFFLLREPENPCEKGVPCQGGLADMIATYKMPSNLYLGGTGMTKSATKDFYVPTFGMSCYSTARESDYGSPPNDCGHLKLVGKVYSDSVTNPGSLVGTYCLAFIEDVILNLGSGVLNNGIAVQKVNGSIGPTPDDKIHTADGPVPVANQTVARDPVIIPRRAGVTMDLDQVGIGIAADDTGKMGYITGYRLDLYKGYGKAACNGYPNPMAVGACTPATSLCPASAIQ
jgi:3D (Asp-Asp-Asp) domain-containing protein